MVKLKEITVSKIRNWGGLRDDIIKDLPLIYAKFNGSEFITKEGKKYNPFWYYERKYPKKGDIYKGRVASFNLSPRDVLEFTYGGEVVEPVWYRYSTSEPGVVWGKTATEARDHKYSFDNKKMYDFFYINTHSPVLIETPLRKLEFVNTHHISINWSGGGYGEKYYVTGVSCYHAPTKLKEIITDVFGKNLTEQFIDSLLTLGMPDDFYAQYDFIPNWAKVLFDNSSWKPIVEYEDYEGYCLKGFKFTSSALATLQNNLIQEAAQVQCRQFKTWEEL